MLLHQLGDRAERMLKELKQLAVRKSEPVRDITICRRGEEVGRPFVNGDVWAEDGEWWNFSFSMEAPADFGDRVILRIQTGREDEWEAVNPEFLARVNGTIWQAFNTKHTTMEFSRGAAHTVELQGYSAPALPGQRPPILRLTIEDRHAQLEQLVYDLSVPYEAAMLLPEGERERELTLESISQALDLLDLRSPHNEAFDASVQRAREHIRTHYYAKRTALPAVAVAECVGHTHIDVAWLWDLYQTRHKVARSFSTVLRLMEKYPEYRFMSSQAALYDMVQQDEPELFERIRERIREGRWEVEGGMWVEADCNLAGGESLVRQFLVGQEFFQRNFGVTCRILWLPDVFGYSAALPQIMKLAGIDYFMTTKLSWSEFNLSPYDTFLWKGIDGSEVLTHFSPSRPFLVENSPLKSLPHFTTYNTMLSPDQIAGGWQRFQQKGLDDHFLVAYGYGDGGGGPTEEMLETARRMEAPLPGTPVVQHAHARPFFEALEARVKGDPHLPKWSGELYLEYHRGTYTAMARNKRSNRKIELLLREVELWSAYAERQMGAAYPAAQLGEIWKDVLTLQFHDILPGSSIQKVYEDSAAMYARRFEELEALRDEAIRALSGAVAGDIAVFNSLSHERDDIVWFDAPNGVVSLRDAEGRLYPVQIVEGRACAFVRGMRPMTGTPLWFSNREAGPEATAAVTADERGFETPLFAGVFDERMHIAGLWDKAAGRQVVKPGEALNKLVCYENKPHNFDAWDVNIYYDRRHWEVSDVESARVISAGPVLALLRVTRRYMASRIVQDIYVYRDLPRIDFDTRVDWREKQYLLKAHFPVDVFYNEATYDIQYGNIRRATHKNTSWDVARFEVCAHKWADVSEAGYGVALLNDCKYGHSIDESGMALTLLKSSVEPNPEADQEAHRFVYSLMPHAGGWREAGAADMAYRLNVPAFAAKAAGKNGALAPFATVDAPNVTIESVKGAQDGDGVIVRLYECFGMRCCVRLALGFAPKEASVCDLLERPIEESLDRDGERVTFNLKPYEIKSIRLRY